MNSSLEYVIECQGDCLFVRVDGEYDRDQMAEILAKLSDRCKLEECVRVLADFRGHTGFVPTMDLYLFGEMVAQLFAGWCRFALVESEDHHEAGHFFETVARNRGTTFRHFRTIEQAEAWLRDPVMDPQTELN